MLTENSFSSISSYRRSSFQVNYDRSMKTFGDRLREARKRKGLTQAQLAGAAGMSQKTISKIERGDQAASTSVAQLARAVGVTALWLTEGRDSPAPTVAEDRLPYDIGQVPVVGTVQAGDEGYWEELQYPTGHGDGFIRYPSRDPNAYALRVKGDSMRPRIKPGEFLLVEPNSAVIPGEEVIVTTVDGRSMVKILGPRRDGMIELQSINEDHRPITIDESQVRAMHYVAGIVKASRYYRDN